MNYLINELFGTFLMIVLGDGINCNVSLNKSGQHGGGPVHTGIGWGAAVMVPAFIFGRATGAHFNPTVTIAMAVNGSLSWSLVPYYIIGQMIGGFLAAAFLCLLYHDHLKAEKNNTVTRGCFCTAPSIRNYGLNALSEATCAFVLVFAILGIGQVDPIGGGMDKYFVYAIIMVIGMAFGGLTGYSMNAARDFSPRLGWLIFCPSDGTAKDADWAYAWIPSLMPIVGGIVAVLVYNALPF